MGACSVQETVREGTPLKALCQVNLRGAWMAPLRFPLVSYATRRRGMDMAQYQAFRDRILRLVTLLRPLTTSRPSAGT